MRFRWVSAGRGRGAARWCVAGGVTGLLAGSLLAAAGPAAIAQTSASNGSGMEVAFQAASTGDLYTFDPVSKGSLNAGLGMAPGTSPAIASNGSGGFEVAFQAAGTDDLYIYNTSTESSFNAGLGMAPGTSPSITTDPSGGYEVAFNAASTDDLYIYNTSTKASFNAGLGMAPGTSPAIASNGSGMQVAFNAASTDDLYNYDPVSKGSSNAGLGMAPGTSPSITTDPSGGYEVAFNAASTDDLYIYNTSTESSFNAGLGMAPGTSPAIASNGSGMQVAFNAASTDDLYIYNTSTESSFNAGLGMADGTSPAIAAPALSPPPTSNCEAANNCTPQTFADELLSYPGVGGVITASNEFAIEQWELEEGGGAGCPGQPPNTAPWANSPGPAGNPLNTELSEPGSTDWNSGGVQEYANSDGETCWYWGVTANATALLNGLYTNILSVLDNPSSSDYDQCIDLSNAVVDSPWGTESFSSLC
jgi:hypothetical protein